MAIYSTFFIARADQILGGFPGWKAPLPSPVRREFLNPFTKQFVSFETREPEWPEEEDDSAIPQHHVVAIKGNYEAYLENRLPPFVREQPHAAAKGLTDIELQPLLGVIGIAVELKSPAYARPSLGAALREFPPEFISRLLASDPRNVAKLWAAEMSTPDHTHSVSGNKLYEGWAIDQALQILSPIISLARKAAANQKMHVLVEA